MTDDLKLNLLLKRRSEIMLANAFRGLRQQGIEAIVIKGWAAARNYPDDVPRHFGDIDLAVSASDYDRAKDLTDKGVEGVVGVDLHCELRHLDTLPWNALLQNSQLINVDNEDVRILSPEDHLRVMCVHWLTDGGENRDRLWDIYYAVANRPEGFDWSHCLDVVDEHRRGWIVAAIGIAHKYLGLFVDDLPFADEAKHLPAWLTRSLERDWEYGVVQRPLHTALRSGKDFIQQVRKRFPPNPIQATIDCEGSFDDRSRIGYQIRDVFIRMGPSLKRVLPALIEK